MATQWVRLLSLALLFSIPGMTGMAAPQSSDWDSLKQLRIGQKIQVVDVKLKSIDGEFSGLSDDGLSVRRGKKELTFSRAEVLRVALRGGGRSKNALVGLTIGALFGFVSGSIMDHLDDVDSSDSGSNNGKLSGAAAGVVIGAGIGAAFPGYHTIYRSNTARTKH